MLTIYFRNFCKSLTAASLFICFASHLHTHARIVPGPASHESYAVSFMRDDVHKPILTTTSIENPTILSGCIRGLTVASNSGYFGKFCDLVLEDGDYEIIFDEELQVLLLVNSEGEGHTIWTPLQYTTPQ